ncbi:DUF4123 domain-containing protein [Stenotrophomonas maltophilia]|uniref:DUF4123 domain-containing protein n=1 Tax=Stenotrophomonas maltophilia TaxID=40324 RepID=UPI0007EFE440|nr:DUF4123 domain-containing protein [Stenotrophomonas maltophilia]OBU48965.1 hypothetical protein A9K76_12745 [Stenotrophomonas maltophilia]
MEYAIVDAAASPQIANVLGGYATSGIAWPLFEHQPEASSADVGPWLIQLNGNGWVRRWLLNLEARPGRVCWVTSDEPIGAVIEHLQARLDVRLSDGGLALFRFWDGRALYRVWTVMTREQKRAFMAPFVRWSVWLQGQQWQLDRDVVEKS